MMFSNDRGEYTCTDCRSTWSGRWIRVWRPVRVKLCRTWNVGVHGVELRALPTQRVEERREATVVRLGFVALVFGADPAPRDGEVG